jgi:hypothetical protein
MGNGIVVHNRSINASCTFSRYGIRLESATYDLFEVFFGQQALATGNRDVFFVGDELHLVDPVDEVFHLLKGHERSRLAIPAHGYESSAGRNEWMMIQAVS